MVSWLLGQWLNFKLFGSTYLVGKIISRSNVVFFRVKGRPSETRCFLMVNISVGMLQKLEFFRQHLC